jgi:prepilin-type N-terminal cleavage/methylation domain-containing protein
MMMQRRRLAARRGVTMIELMISLGIVSIGLLALASGATLVTRLMGGGATQSRAAAAAYSHIEQLRSLSCASVSSGADTVRGIVTSWTATAITVSSARRGYSVNVIVQYPTAKGTRTQAYRTILPC